MLAHLYYSSNIKDVFSQKVCALGETFSVLGNGRSTLALALIKLHTETPHITASLASLPTGEDWESQRDAFCNELSSMQAESIPATGSLPTSALQPKSPAGVWNEMHHYPKKNKSIRRNRDLITWHFISSENWGSSDMTAEGPSRNTDYQKLGFFMNQTDSCGNPRKNAGCTLRGLGDCSKGKGWEAEPVYLSLGDGLSKWPELRSFVHQAQYCQHWLAVAVQGLRGVNFSQLPL